MIAFQLVFEVEVGVFSSEVRVLRPKMRRRRIVTHREATGNKSPPEEDATAISIKNLFYSLLIFR